MYSTIIESIFNQHHLGPGISVGRFYEAFERAAGFGEAAYGFEATKAIS